ncbi:hypothetical protein APHAL10511_003936 [Amanita phalloides]|nr:hypothetical protein APHAL10511_003936 [Amanita phalloides]
MTQPHLSKGTTAWFWWMACHDFERLGLFLSTLSCLGFKDKGGIGYMPTQFIHKGEFLLDDLVPHFFKCGLTGKDSNSLFRDFARCHITSMEMPPKPDWSMAIPVPRVLRPSMSQRRKTMAKRGRTLTECIEGGSGHNQRADHPLLSYDKGPPAGGVNSPSALANTRPNPDLGEQSSRGMYFELSPMGPG